MNVLKSDPIDICMATVNNNIPDFTSSLPSRSLLRSDAGNKRRPRISMDAVHDKANYDKQQSAGMDDLQLATRDYQSVHTCSYKNRPQQRASSYLMALRLWYKVHRAAAFGRICDVTGHCCALL